MTSAINILGLVGGVNYGRPRDQLSTIEMAAGRDWIVGSDGVLTRRHGYTANGISGRVAAVDELIDRKSGGRALIELTAGDDRRIISEQITAGDYQRYYLYQLTGHDRVITSAESDDVVLYMQVDSGNVLSSPALLGGALGYNFAYYDPNSEYPYSLVDGVFDASHYAAALASQQNQHRAKCMCVFDGRVFLGGTYEMTSAGQWTALPYRLRWSQRRSFTSPNDWNDADFNSTAGYDHTIADSSMIMNMAVLGDTLYIYCDNGIRAGYATQSVTAPIRFIDVNGRGLYAANALAVTDTGHFYLGADNRIYVNRGGVEPDWIGKKIESDLFGTVNVPYKERIFAGEIRELDAVFFAVPTGSEQWPRTMYVYFYRTDVWQVWKPGHYICCCDRQGRVFGSQNLVLTFDREVNSDIGEYINAYAVTGDYISDLSSTQRVRKMFFEAWSDGNVQLQVGWSSDSTELYGDFNDITPVTITEGWNRYELNFDTGHQYKVRFLFQCKTYNGQIKLGRIWTEIT